jgi:hypothetical protein
MHVREVLPGDPDPDVVLEVSTEMRAFPFDTVATSQLDDWADRLEGKQ